MQKQKVDMDIAKGKHYKKGLTITVDMVGEVMDVAFIAAMYEKAGRPLTAMQVTALKKLLVMGNRGNKSYEQDGADIIGAIERDVQLHGLFHSEEEQSRGN